MILIFDIFWLILLLILILWISRLIDDSPQNNAIRKHREKIERNFFY